jgi:hypothetical protein
MNFNSLVQEVFNEDGSFDVATEGDYIILLNDTTFSDAEYGNTDVPFKAGTVFEVIFEDEEDMSCWYVVELKDGVPGSYVNRNQEYIIGMGKEDIKNTKCVNKKVYETLHGLEGDAKETWEDILS